MLVTYIICGQLERRNTMIDYIINILKGIFKPKEEKEKPKEHKKREPVKKKPKPIKGLNPKKKRTKTGTK